MTDYPAHARYSPNGTSGSILYFSLSPSPCNKKQNTALRQQNSSTYPKGQCPRACKCCNQQHNQRNKIFAGMMPQIAFCFPITDWMLPFQHHRQNGALQGEYKKCPHMDKIKATAYHLPTAKVDAGDNAVDRKDKQAILPTKSPRLSGKHTDCLLQIRVAGQQRTDWGV